MAMISTSTPVNPLANPKGTKLLCELCQKPAFLQCQNCRCTYWCGSEHQRVDAVGIHDKICSLLPALRRAEMPYIVSEEDRQKFRDNLRNQKLEMIQLTRTAGERLLFEGKHEQAVPAAMQSLRFAIDVHGLASVELVPSYLILGEASIGLGQSDQAEEYLAQAEWTVLKNSDVSNLIKHKLFRNIGMLHASRGEFPEALRNFSDDIYHASEEVGPKHIRVSGGYFHMANIFFRQNKRDVALSLYQEVCDIWYEYLVDIVRYKLMRARATAISDVTAGTVNTLNEAQEAEAKQVLYSIHDLQTQLEEIPTAMRAKVLVALGMLHLVLSQLDKSKEFLDACAEYREELPDGHGLLSDMNDLEALIVYVRSKPGTTGGAFS